MPLNIEHMENSNEDLYSRFAKAKDCYNRKQTEENRQIFFSILAEAVENDMVLPVPVISIKDGASECWPAPSNCHDESIRFIMSYNLSTWDIRGAYLSILSSEKLAKQGVTVIWTGLQEIIETVYSDPHIKGIAVDPYTEPLYIERMQIDAYTIMRDPRLKKRNWGKGKPRFCHGEDLLTREEKLDLAMQVVEGYCLRFAGYSILETIPVLGSAYHFMAEKKGCRYLVFVECVFAPAVPLLEEWRRQRLLASAKTTGAKCIYAPVVLASCDSYRSKHSMPLVGDTYKTVSVEMKVLV